MGHPEKQRKAAGQTLAEYILAGGLVALVGLGALVFLSGTLQSALPDLLNRIFGDGPASVAGAPSSGGTSAGSPAGGSLPGPGGSSLPPTGPIPSPAYDTVQVTLANGQTLNLPNFPTRTATLVETAGVSGATSLMLAQMQTLIDELAAAGEITPAQVNMLRDLANAGHEIAEVERLLEEAAAASGGNMTTYRNMPVTYKGQTYTVTEWGNRIGYRGENVDLFASDPFNRSRMDYPNSPLGIFSERYEDAINSGAMADPAVQTVVTHLANEILLIAGMAEYQVDNMTAPYDLAQGAASQLTHLDSGGICQTGGGTDTGIHCP